MFTARQHNNSNSTIDYDLLYPGAFSMLKVRLKAGESMKAESDAMVAMSNTIDVGFGFDRSLF